MDAVCKPLSSGECGRENWPWEPKFLEVEHVNYTFCSGFAFA